MWHEWTPEATERETIEGYWPELVKAGADVVATEKWLVKVAWEAERLRQSLDGLMRWREEEAMMELTEFD